ncbi:MAG: HEAT repeat domain-containing protein [Xanthomonadaceae bacterium]|nr:HEAT repeat domain-containing protein [Xanthomonadaceae bacterium]
MLSKSLLCGGIAVSALLMLSGCAPTSYAVKTPQPSSTSYTAESQAGNVGFVDSRGMGERTFNTGVLPATLTVNGAPLNGAEYLKAGVEAELAARGLPVRFGDAAVFPKVDLRSFRMLNHRQNGYSPYVTFTFISADVETAAGKKRIGVFVKRGKVPVWSFAEVVEPTMNEPLSIAVKEFSAKVARELYGARASDADVDALIARLAKPGDEQYLDVYALGFTNHPKAVGTLARLAKDDHEYVRIAAISSLGTLRASEHLDLLKDISRNAQTWQDRAMALKAIGDLDTAESRAFIAEQKAYWQGKPAEKESNWTLQVLDLYP